MKFFGKFKRADAAPQPVAPIDINVTPGQNCPVWHDIARALNQSPRPSGERPRAKGNRTASSGSSR